MAYKSSTIIIQGAPKNELSLSTRPEVFIDLIPPRWTVYGTRSVFKGSKADLISEFFFLTDCLVNTEEPRLFFYSWKGN